MYSYYGDHISKNIVKTEEGYLICCNVPIGRIGIMKYLGQELPAEFNCEPGVLYEVNRSPEELFSPATIASFEGKPITNYHPAANLDVTTVTMAKRGHAQNVRRDGDYLIADLFIDDPVSIQEVESKQKREISSGYDCSWHEISKGKYEQRNIIGNHIALVPAGRAGAKVAIKDALPDIKIGGKKMEITKKILQAIGFKHYAADAEPEEIAKAMDAMNEPEEKAAKAEPEKKPEAKDADPAPAAEPKGNEAILALLKEMAERIEALEGKGSAADEETETAESVLDEAEKGFEAEKPEEKPDAKDAEPEETPKKKAEEKEEVEDEADPKMYKKVVADMRPIIMAISDERLRIEGARILTKFAKDARNASAANGYADIIQAVNANKKAAMDKVAEKSNIKDQAKVACSKWDEAGNNLRNKGGK